jgi:type I restriction enzyme S subunit
MKRYDSYKPSGIEWIGEVPSHWRGLKFKYFVDYQKGKKSAEEFTEYNHNLIPYLSMEYLREQTDTPLYVAPESNIVIVNENDYLLLWDGSKAGEFVKAKNGALSSTMAVLKIDETTVERNFVWYLFKALEPIIQSDTIGMGIPHVDGGNLKRQCLFIPSIEEQTSIASYLDTKTAQIDTLIKKKEELLTLLQKKRQAIISEAVTRGLNKKAPTKPSGIDWLGDIPAHWQVKKLKYLVSKIGSGVTPTGGAENYLDEGVPLLRSQNVYNEGLRLDDVAFISQETHDDMSNTKVQPGDVLLNITGASIGRSFYFDGSLEEANVNQHVCIVRPNQELLETRYLHFVLISNIGQLQIDLSQTGANREGLNNFQLGNFTIAFPSTDEQNKIVKELDNSLNQIDKCNNEITEQIEKLKAYRQSLIAEVVTGKVKVV